MPEYKSTDELRDFHPDAQRDYLTDVDVLSEDHWDLYRDLVEDYSDRELHRKRFTADDGTAYLISVEQVSDGEGGDTRINIVNLDSG